MYGWLGEPARGGASSTPGFSLPAALTEVSAGVARLCSAPDPGKEQLLQQVKETGAAVVQAAARGALDRASKEATQLQGLANNLQFQEGWSGQLDVVDVEELWAVCCKLWDGSLAFCEAGQAPKASSLLDEAAKGLFASIEGSQEGLSLEAAAARVAFFYQACQRCSELGRAEQASWLLGCAMRSSEDLATYVSKGKAAVGGLERHVVQLYQLYLQGAKMALAANQQALLGNLLAKALLLTAQAAVRCAVRLCMAIGIAELQLEQACSSLDAGDPAQAAALLSAAYRELCNPGLVADAEDSDSGVFQNLRQCKQQVLTLLCKTHLRLGDGPAALACMDDLPHVCDEWPTPETHLLLMEAFVLAGMTGDAFGLLDMVLHPQDGRLSEADVDTWLAMLDHVLSTPYHEAAAKLQSSVAIFVETMLDAPGQITRMLKSLLLNAKGGWAAECRRLALEVLVDDAVAMAFTRVLHERSLVYRLLWEAGSCLLEAGDAASAEPLLSAAYHYADRAAERCKAARVLAVCNLRQGRPQRGLDYLEMAAREEAAPALATALLRLQTAMQLGDHSLAEKVMREVDRCEDFHSACLDLLIAASEQSQSPGLLKEALALACRVLVSDGTGQAALPADLQVHLLLTYAQAVVAFLAEGGAVVQEEEEAAALLFQELAAAITMGGEVLGSLGRGPNLSEEAAGFVFALWSLAYNSSLKAFKRGLASEGFQLLNAACALLLRLDPAPSSTSSSRQHAESLLTAAQVLLNSHWQGAARARCLALAASALAKAAKLLAGRDWAAQLQQTYWTLAAVAACRQRIDAAAAASLARLLEHSGSLPASSLRVIMEEVDSGHGLEVQRAACSLLFGALERGPAPGILAVVPPVLKVLRLEGRQQLALFRACARQAAGGEAGEGVVTWLVSTAWNAGRRGVEARQLALGGALLQAALGLLQASAAPQDAPLLQRMAAAIAGLGPLPPLPEPPAAADAPEADTQAGAPLLAPAVHSSEPGPEGSSKAHSPPAPAPVQSRDDAGAQPIPSARAPSDSAQPQGPPKPAAATNAAPAPFTFPRLAPIAPRESPALQAKDTFGSGALADSSPSDDAEEGGSWLDAIMAARSLCGDGGAPAAAAAPAPALAEASAAPDRGPCLTQLSLDGASALSLEDSGQG